MALPYLDLGGPPDAPLIHLAPANGFPPESYRPLAAGLTPAFRVRGYRPRPLWPRSRPHDVRSWHQLADDLLSDLASLTDEPVLGVGHSLGGILSLYCAVRQPERFRGLALIDPVVMPRRLLPLLWAMRRLGQQHRFPLARGASRRRDRFASLEEARARLRGRGAFTDFTPEALDGYLEGALRPDPEGGLRLAWPREWEAHIFAMVPIDSWDFLSRLRVPLLIIRGTRSELMIDASWQTLARRLPQARLVSITGGHMVPMEQPAAVAAAIMAWAQEAVK
jgi:pimeloyl-ACP methyl ester carboxylesterase